MRLLSLLVISSFLFLLSINIRAQENQDWKWSHQTPQGNTLRWVKMWDANNWYAIGFGGTFMKTTDAGTTWYFHHQAGVPSTNGSTSALYEAHFFDMNTGVAVGTGGATRTTDGGLTWTVTTGIPTAATMYQLYFLDNNIGYCAGTTSGRFARTSDGGQTWTINTVLPSGTYYDCYSPNDTFYVVSSTSGNIRTSTDAGLTWSATINTGASFTIYKLEFRDPLNGWVAGSTGQARYTTDGGATWNAANTGLPTSTIFYDLDLQTVTAQTLDEGFEGTTFPPAGWKAVDVLGANVWNRSTTQAHSGTASAFVNYQSTGGEDWLLTPQLSIVAGDSVKFWVRKNFSSAFPPDSLLIRVSTTDTALASFGAAIIAIDVANLTASTWLQFSADLSAYAGQSIYLAFHHKDSDGNGVWVDDVEVGTPTVVNEVYLTGNSFDIYKTIDNGLNWTMVEFLNPSQPWTSTYYATEVNGNSLLTAGAFGLINSVSNGGTPTAHTQFVRAGALYDVWAAPGGDKVIAVGAPSSTGSSFDQITYTTNGGGSWNSATTTLRPNTQLNGTIHIDEQISPAEITKENETDLLMVANSYSTFRSIDMVNPDTGYVVGSLGAVYRTTNGGTSWDSLTTPIAGTASLYKVDFVDYNTGWIFSNTSDATGTIWKTTDAGTTWSQQILTGAAGNDQRIYNASMLDANTGWIVNYTPRPYRTTDGGATWELQTLVDGFGGFLYDIQMIDANLGFACGSSRRLYKTTNGGANWDTLTAPTTSVTFQALHFRDENYGVVTGTGGVTLLTTDGGLTWTVAQLNNAGATMNSIYIEPQATSTAATYTVGASGFIFKNTNVTVPVELSTFTASVSKNNVSLTWSTSSEKNNRGFQVERKNESGDWHVLGFVEGNGTTTNATHYSFKDENVAVGHYNYRLRQIDYDGTYKYYNLSETIEIGAPLNFALEQNYPNPFNPTTNIRYSVAISSHVVLKIYNVLGAEVATLVNEIQEAGIYTKEFSADQSGLNLSSGVYFYRLEAGNFTDTKKFILMK
ncbi:MAG: choice-of-anchor J domain-containing protein [Ignavibacteriales bacterium]|nr:MAG: choice-of-anchor J domain-containing protein [Ignavibacteriales bacterium]